MSKPLAFEDPSHDGNSPKHHTGKECIEAGCNSLAGTAWSRLWCFDHNVERMRRISQQLAAIASVASTQRSEP